MRNQHGNMLPVALAASAILGLITSMGFLLVSENVVRPLAELTLTPSTAVVNQDAVVTVDVTVRADVSVNVFGGTIVFDESILAVDHIDYNTSIADLWAEAPWYEKGAGTISFGGGTTRNGGFTGSGSLMTVSFRALTPGGANIALRDIQILQHDGLGTALSVETPIDSILTIVPKESARTDGALVVVRSSVLPSDLSGDGVVSIRDASILLGYLATGDRRGDIDNDGYVNLHDISILMSGL